MLIGKDDIDIQLEYFDKNVMVKILYKNSQVAVLKLRKVYNDEQKNYVQFYFEFNDGSELIVNDLLEYNNDF